MRLPFLLTLTLTLSSCAPAADPPKAHLGLHSQKIAGLGLPLAESDRPIFAMSLSATLDPLGEGSGILTLDPNGLATYDEFGFAIPAPAQPAIKLDCTLKFVKKTTAKGWPFKHMEGPTEAKDPKDRPDYEWRLYSITGPKVTSRLFLVLPIGQWAGTEGRVLVHDDKGTVKYVVDLEILRIKPCHPGCFLAGTPVRVPGGTLATEKIREGDLVTSIDGNGHVTAEKVTGVFVTRNRVLELRVEGATLVTTETQPVCLEAGGFRAASELKIGDRIWRWTGSERRAVEVKAITTAVRESDVFNLVLGEPKAFVAGDFLVRSKPPAVLPVDKHR